MIRVHIERLVLDGLALGPGGAEGLRAAVEHHLAAALAGREPRLGLTGGISLPDLHAADIAVDATRPGLTGPRLAASLATSLGGSLR